MAKQLLILFMTVVLTFVTVSVYAETPEIEQEEVEEFMDELGESSQSFTIPINVGPIYSAIIRHDGIGIAFSMIKSKSLSLTMEAVSFLTDLKEMDIFLENGNKYTIPAVVQLLNQDVGSFIILNYRESSQFSCRHYFQWIACD